MNKTYAIMDDIVKGMSELKNSGRIDHVAINWSLDRRGLHVEINMIVKGVEKKIACVYASNTEDIAKKVMGKVALIIRPK